MTTPASAAHLLARLEALGAPELRRLLVEHLTSRKIGLYWEGDAIARDAAINADVVLPRHVADLSHRPEGMTATVPHRNLIIEGDNFDALRLLKSTHAGRVRVIYIDPPYNTGNKDWVYNDRYVGANDRWRHSQWLEFLYRRLSLARDLLTSDGVILVSINDSNRARLDLLMEEVFPGRRVGSFIWKTRSGANDDARRFSSDHEHVLVYANEAFNFLGEAKDFSQYRNPDKDVRGPWKTGDLSKAHTYLERPNTYYPIQDPDSGIWYPCNPSMVWRFSSESRIADPETLRAKTMEQYIREGKVIFPSPGTEKVAVWNTKQELIEAIRAGDVPSRPKTKTPLLNESLPDLDFWVGKQVGFGRPWFKRHRFDVQSELRPVSSWIRGTTDDGETDDFTIYLIAQRSGTGEHSVNEILGFNAFSFPKPPSLLRVLLSQVAKPNDIVLDFFAGSGTTGQAVLQLNAEDGGQRRYILCSSTEATKRVPDKNLCRDVCAERLRRVSSGYGGKSGFSAEQGGEFAYLQLDRVAPADIPFEATVEHTHLILSLRLTQSIQTFTGDAVQAIARAGDCDILLCTRVDTASIETLVDWPRTHGVTRIAVYSERPDSLSEALSDRGVDAVAYGLYDALRHGQAGNAP